MSSRAALAVAACTAALLALSACSTSPRQGASSASSAAPPAVAPSEPPSAALGPPPAELVRALGLSTVYARWLDVETLPVLGTAKTSDFALREAAYLVRKMIGHRPDVLRAMAAARVRLVVMAPTELTTDVPEHADLVPRDYWDRRARGLGATDARPAVSCAEENLLSLDGDPYSTESILVHEFSHAIHEMGLRSLDPTFDGRLAQAFAAAREKGLWSGTYASTNEREYWAEGAQSWFDTNRANDAEHGPIDTREKLVAYDPALAALLREVFGDGPWRYQRPDARPPAERAHLAGFDRSSRPKFAWFVHPPASGSPRSDAPLPWLAPGAEPSVSPSSTEPASILFTNQRSTEVQVVWVDFDGAEKLYLRLRPGVTAAQSTFAGHVFRIRDGAVLVGAVVAAPGEGRAVIE